MIRLILEILIMLADNILLVMLLHYFCKPQKNNNIISLLIILILFSENIILYNIIKSNHLANFVPVLTLILYSIYFLNGSISKKIESIILIFVNMIIVNGIFIVVGSLFNPTMASIFTADNNLAYLMSAASKLLIFLEYLYLKNFYRTELELTYNAWRFILTILIVSIFAIDLSLNEYTTRNVSVIYIGITIITFVLLNVFVFSLCLTMSRQSIAKANQDILIESLKYEGKILDVANKMTLELRNANHDFKHHMSVVRQMVEENSPEITDYLNKLSTLENLPRNIIHTNNTVLNYILNDKIEIANKSNIKVNHKLIGADVNLNYINNIDLSIIIGNLFDNAIESCNLVTGEKNINIEITMSKSKTIFIIENSTIIKKIPINDKLTTSKKDKERHGYGLISIKNNINKYNGELIYYAKDYVFTCQCAIPNAQLLSHKKL